MLQVIKTAVKFMRFLYGHQFIGIAMNDQHWAGDALYRLANIDLFQIVKK